MIGGLLGGDDNGGERAALTEEQRTLVADCAKRSAKLDDEERRFIDNIQRQSFPLTSKQDAWLGEIWERVT